MPTARSRLVAAMMRTSTRTVRCPPTRRNSPVSSTRSSFACSDGPISPISSRKRVPPWASSNWPSFFCMRVGEGAALVAEQLALEQGLGDGGAVERDERLAGARAAVVDRACAISSLPVPLSPVISTVVRSGATVSDGLEGGLHARRAADRCCRGGSAVRPRMRSASTSRTRAAFSRRLVEHEPQLLDVERLGQVVERAELHGADRRLHGLRGGQHDDRAG